MFDIGFFELLVIGIVALVVIGPERLPKVARTVGQWLGRMNRYVAQVKQDIDRDMRLEELRKMQQEMKDSAQKYEIMAGESLRQAEKTVAEETSSLNKVMQAMSATDGGLTMREYEKIQAEQSVASASADNPVLEDTGSAQAASAEAVPSGLPPDDLTQTGPLQEPVKPV